CGVIDIHTSAQWKTASEHDSIARSSPDREYKRHKLQIPNPDRIKALVVNTERSQKSAGGNGQVSVRNVVHLQIVELLFDISLEGAVVRGSFVLALNASPGLDEPAISYRNQENRIDLGN